VNKTFKQFFAERNFYSILKEYYNEENFLALKNLVQEAFAVTVKPNEMLESTLEVRATNISLRLMYGKIIKKLHDEKRGYDLFLLSQLPDKKSREAYQGAYVLIRNDPLEGSALYYCGLDDAEFIGVKVDDVGKLLNGVAKFRQKDSQKISLTHDQIKELITSNGGHKPDEK
jgi:hypothetical protein